MVYRRGTNETSAIMNYFKHIPTVLRLAFFALIFLAFKCAGQEKVYVTEWDFVKITKDTSFTQTEGQLSFIETESNRKYKVTVTLEPVLQVVAREDFTLTGTWETPMDTRDPFLNNSCAWSIQTGATLSLTFTGQKIELVTSTDKTHGIVAITIDDGPQENVDLYSATRKNFTNVFSKTVPYGDHTIKLRVTGTKNPSATNVVGIVDYFLVYQ